MSVFAAIVDGGSLSAAGRRLNVPLATVSRKLADLEAHLKTRLITRSTRKLVLTDAGRDYLAACRQILEQVDEAERAASGAYAKVKGQLVVAAPIVFGRLHVVPVAAAFLEAAPRGRHPDSPGRPQRQPHRGACRRRPANRRAARQQPRRDAGGNDQPRGVREPRLSGAVRHAAVSGGTRGARLRHVRRSGCRHGMDFRRPRWRTPSSARALTHDGLDGRCRHRRIGPRHRAHPRAVLSGRRRLARGPAGSCTCRRRAPTRTSQPDLPRSGKTSDEDPRLHRLRGGPTA